MPREIYQQDLESRKKNEKKVLLEKAKRKGALGSQDPELEANASLPEEAAILEVTNHALQRR